MKYAFLVSFIVLNTGTIFSQTINNTIQKVETLNVKGNTVINIKQGNVTINSIVVTADANRAKIFLRSVNQFKDTFDIWHTNMNFRSLDSNLAFPVYLTFKADKQIIKYNVKLNNNWGYQANVNWDSTRRGFNFISNTMSSHDFSFYISSWERIKLEIYGVLGKIDD